MVTSPQDEGDEEDDVGDQDEDVPEGEPPPHCLRPETQKQNWGFPSQQTYYSHIVWCYRSGWRQNKWKSWRSNIIRAEVIGGSSSNTILVSLFFIPGHVRPRLKKAIVCRNLWKHKDAKKSSFQKYRGRRLASLWIVGCYCKTPEKRFSRVTASISVSWVVVKMLYFFMYLKLKQKTSAWTGDWMRIMERIEESF